MRLVCLAAEAFLTTTYHPGMGSAERSLSLRTIFYRTGAISWECVETEVENRVLRNVQTNPKQIQQSFPPSLETIDMNSSHLFAGNGNLLM